MKHRHIKPSKATKKRPLTCKLQVEKLKCSQSPNWLCFAMQYNELRKDYLLNRWVVIATERGRRPTDFTKQKTEATQSQVCPMCVGNEAMTPPATMLYLKEEDDIKRTLDPTVGERPKNWLVRCIPNMFPAFTQEKQLGDVEQIFKSDSFGYALGAHEVIIETPSHTEGPADMPLPQMELVVHAYIDRLRELGSPSYVRYVSIFRNFGKEAGASLSHPHSQIIATPMVPPPIQEEMDVSKSFYEKNKKCAFCEIIEREAAGSRLIADSDGFLVFAPYASINPMEFWIAPKKHAANILSLTEEEVKSFAHILQASLKALKTLLNDPPYNYGFHLSIDPAAESYYHWHLEVYPKLTIWAGFEISTGIFINTVTPEAAAESLRKSIKS
jgi:UDPglucose--hexose-1-phosphate uridylyltransferase